MTIFMPISSRPRAACRVDGKALGIDFAASSNYKWLQSNRGSPGQFGSGDFRPKRRQYPAATWNRTGAEAQTKHNVERLHSVTHGCAGRHGLLYGGSAHVDNPDAMAMEQMARNATLEELGCLVKHAARSDWAVS